MIHFLINGFPYYFSDGDTALSGATATLKPWIMDAASVVRSIRHEVEPWGGVVRGGGISVRIADADMSLSRVLPLSPDLAAVRCLEHQVLPTASAEVLVDVSDNSGLSIGDVLQCPYDAWEITAVGPVQLPTGILCDRGIYSCFPGYSWIFQPYYQRGSGQTELFSFGRNGQAPEIDGRVCTLWIDGALAWIGIVSSPRQQGPIWTFSARHVLDGWRDKFSAEALPSFALDHRGGAAAWWQGLTIPGDSLSGITALGAIPSPHYPQEYGWTTDDLRGLSFLGAGEPEMTETLRNRGTLAALGDKVSYDSSLGRYVTKLAGTPKYGWIDDPLMPISVSGALSSGLVDQYLSCPDGLAGTVRKKIAAVSVVNGTITLDQETHDEDGNWIDGFGGFSSAGPIFFQVAPIVSAGSIPRLIYALLVSTGSGDNGDHDILPGYLGLGLPEELIDDRISDLFYDTQIIDGDLSDVNLDDELQAAGVWLLWCRGQFAIREVAAPIALNTMDALDETRLDTSEAPEVDRASISPILSLHYTASNKDDLTINVRVPQIFRPVAGASKELKSGLRPSLPDYGQQGALASLAYWLSRYAPSIRVELIPHHEIALGDTVALSCPFVAGVGDAYGGDPPAIVVGVGETYANLLINTQPSGGRLLAPALRVITWKDERLTVLGGALQWLTLAGLDGDLVLHDETTGDVQVVEIASITDDYTVVLSAAVTLTAGNSVILTVPTWESSGAVSRENYTYLADVAEQIDGDPGHVYVH